MFTSLTLIVALMPVNASPDAQTPNVQAPDAQTTRGEHAVVANPATRMALDLCLQRVELVEKETLYKAKHPAVAQQRRRVVALERSLRVLAGQGYRIDQRHVDAVLDALLQLAKADLAVARQELTASHPRLALLELHLQALAHVAARRALAT